MLRMQAYLRVPHNNGIFPDARYIPLVICPDEPHPAYQRSQEILTWVTEVRFDSLKPFFSVKAITPTYVSSYRGNHLSGLIVGTPDSIRVLGYESQSQEAHSITGIEVPGGLILACNRIAEESLTLRRPDRSSNFVNMESTEASVLD
ncbi:MAG: hypothetical protein Q9199_006659 [Rusavskia elegans]